jgi:DNA repair protein RecN (Recombination protein N)
MLTELRVKNFAIIDQLELNFAPGLTTFTGETGTGKSIIIEAIETLLGSRADNTQIRSGAERAIVEATFQINEKVYEPVVTILKREALYDDPEYLVLGRELRRNNRSIARVNGSTVNVSLLNELGEYLVDIHGQSEHLSLLRVSNHLMLLDRYAEHDDLLDNYQTLYHRFTQVRQELKTLRQSEQETARRADLLAYQINEIEAANLQAGEDEELREERNRLSNAEGLASLTQEALQILDEGDPERLAVSDLLGQVVNNLKNLTRIDPSISHLHTKLENIFEDLTDLNRTLRAYLEEIEFNPKRLEQVEERLGTIHSLKRKYGDTIEAILTFGEQAHKDLETITNTSDRISQLENEAEILRAQLADLGLALSDKRHLAAQKLGNAIENELEDLRMEGARFQIDFLRRPDPQGLTLPNGERVTFNVNGLERVEFFVETNPGEGLKPLVKTASGGETSRLMLALKNVLARADTIPTLIFDEIDQGIGGRVGTIVGHKLWSLTYQHQVFCITHLAQLAAFGHQHYLVQKEIKAERTITNVKPIKGEERLNELAQMLGEVSVGTLRSAQEMLQTARELTSTP